MRLCFVGYGAIAEHHARAFTALDQDFAWVVGRDPEQTAQFAERHSFRRHTLDLAEALADPDVDAVVVTSPSQLHEAQTRQALEAGKHVLCEIPLALSLSGGRSLAELARARGRLLMVAHTQRYYEGLVELKRRIDAGEVKPTLVDARFMFRRHENVGWTGRRRTWTDNLLWHHGGHAVDTTLWLLGSRAARVRAELATPYPKTGIPMDVAIALRTEADQLATVTLSYHHHGNTNEFLVVGEDATYTWRSGVLLAADGSVVLEPDDSDPLKSGVYLQDREFVEAVAAGRQPHPSADDILPCLEVLQAVQDTGSA